MRRANWSISRICSFQNTRAFAPAEQRSSRRLHGLQLPLHPQQVVGWVALLGIATGTFAVVLPHLGPKLQALTSGLLATTLSLHVVSHLLALLIDPADPQVRAQSTSKIVPEFDRAKHQHVIENGRCHLCNITTRNTRTKHCSVCNKCIAQFDHHCKWLNNCVGGRNYTAFLVCVVSAVVLALAVTGLSVAELTLFNVSGNFLNWDRNMDNATMPVLASAGTGSLVVISVVGILSAIAAALLIHLCFFHGYLTCLGLTTYEYVRRKRQRDTPQETAVSQNTIGSDDRCSSFRIDGNPAARFAPPRSTNEGRFDENQQSVYICSTHQSDSGDGSGGGDKKRNFRLYFSYETRDSETSIEVSSRSVDGAERRPESIEFKPSTPSPVSCCFSMIAPASSGLGNRKGKSKEYQKSPVEKERGTRSCVAIRRIQTFFRSRLKRGSRQRSVNGSEAGRSRKNKVNPSTITDSVREKIENNAPMSPSAPKLATAVVQAKPPLKLPPLVLPPRHRVRQIISTSESVGAGTAPTTALKRSQPLRVRRSSFYKRPRYKMGPHVTGIAQLSPIPESESSKPASPRTPPKPNFFSFPSSIPSRDSEPTNNSTAT